MADRSLPTTSGSLPPHVWTIPEIKALPEFGPDHGWFYGLVKVEYDDDDETGVEIAEILPGIGWAAIDPPDVAEAWEQITHDLTEYRPFDADRAGRRAVQQHGEALRRLADD